MKIADIIAAAQTESPRFRAWLSIMLHLEAEIDREGNILSERPDDHGITFAGLNTQDDGIPADPELISPGLIVSKYKSNYWTAAKAEALPYPIGEIVADIALNEGGEFAGKILQQSLNDLGEDLQTDGVIGQNTLQSAYRHDSRELAEEILRRNDAHYRHIADVNPAKLIDLNGWLNRDGLLRSNYLA